MTIGILAVISGQAVYAICAQPWGEIKAHLDLLRGKHYILAYCKLAEARDEHNRVLNKYGIEVVAVGGCHVTEEFSDEVRGYNFVSLNAISEKYGKDFFLRVFPQRKRKHYRDSE